MCCLRFQLRRGETSACRLHFDPLSSPTLRSWKHTEVKLLKSDHLSLRPVRGCEELRPTSPGPPEALDEALPSHPSRSWETEGAVSPSVPLTRPLPYTHTESDSQYNILYLSFDFFVMSLVYRSVILTRRMQIDLSVNWSNLESHRAHRPVGEARFNKHSETVLFVGQNW